MWPLHVGTTFPALAPATAEILSAFRFDSIDIQTLVPCEWNRRVILIHPRDDFERIRDDGSEDADEE